MMARRDQETTMPYKIDNKNPGEMAESLRYELATLEDISREIREHPYREDCGQADAIADRIAAIREELAR